jgi:hypothetical protein
MKAFSDQLSAISSKKVKVIACKTVGEEIQRYLPPTFDFQSLEFGLHEQPKKLNEMLQGQINQVKNTDVILLGYGLCCKGTIGLSSRSKLVIPRVHDCISIFMGSQRRYKGEFYREPGTYYLTKGWIEHGGDPYREFLKLQELYDEDKAFWLAKKMIENYSRLVFINTGDYQLDRYRAYAQMVAKKFSLRFEEIKGSDSLIKKMLSGIWDDEFIVLNPGERVEYGMFVE